jgi:hypothetical protein
MEGRAECVFKQSRRGVRLRCMHTQRAVTFVLLGWPALQRRPLVFWGRDRA